MQEYIKRTRKCGLAVNTSVVIVAASGIIMSHDANQLAENDGGIKLRDAWAKNLFKHMGYVKRKACSAAKIDVEDFDKVKEKFLFEKKNIVAMDEIPHELMTRCYVPATPWTVEE